VPFTDVAKTFDEQVSRAIELARAERFVPAAAAVAQIVAVERAHLAAVLDQLERGNAHNAVAALELIQDIYRPARAPVLRLVRDGSRT
jgi:fructose-1,6-bisphosphatase